MKNIRVFLSENFQFLEVKFSIYLNKHVFVMLFVLSIYVYTLIYIYMCMFHCSFCGFVGKNIACGV